ncbi:MAG: T9SS type A sorting domain-containing protein [Flavobacteriales bacterium]
MQKFLIFFITAKVRKIHSVNDYFQLKMHTDMQVENITILNAMGQRVYSHNGSWNKPIDIRQLAAGVYVVQVRFEERLYKERLMVH